MNLDLLPENIGKQVKILQGEVETLIKEIENSTHENDIRHKLKPALLGDEGAITKLMSFIKELGAEDKKEYAKFANQVKQSCNEILAKKTAQLEALKAKAKLDLEKIDETLPVKNIKIGTLHPITKVSNEIIKILEKYGFKVYDGPEIDSCDNNFTQLNIPENHPARQMQDTFYLNQNGEKNSDYILRTQTSTIQIHAMKNNKPPIYGISLGKVFRSDSDATHSPMFYQIECFAVDKGLNMSNLNFIINELFYEFFEREINIRFRPSFFPFTEPSAEVDISYIKGENGIEICKSDKFLEIGGCGMIHENVLKNCGIDPNEYQGFALGFGVDRMAMLKYGAPDIRKFYTTSQEWIKNNNFHHFKV